MHTCFKGGEGAVQLRAKGRPAGFNALNLPVSAAHGDCSLHHKPKLRQGHQNHTTSSAMQMGVGCRLHMMSGALSCLRYARRGEHVLAA